MQLIRFLDRKCCLKKSKKNGNKLHTNLSCLLFHSNYFLKWLLIWNSSCFTQEPYKCRQGILMNWILAVVA